MDCYITFYKFKDAKEEMAYVGTDLEKANEEAHERSDWATKIWIEVWSNGEFSNTIWLKGE